MPVSKSHRILFTATTALCLGACTAHAANKPPRKTPAQLRADYLASIGQSVVATPSVRTAGSLWSPDGALVDAGVDYKAHRLNDLITISVSVQTTAAQDGSVNSSRDFSTSSAITGLVGALSTTSTNPLLAAQSSTKLKGTGQTSSNTAFSTRLSGQVIAILPNGNMVIEAHRQIEMNNQHEEVVVRGVARPGDVSPANLIASSSLSSLEIELKGKGIISNSVRPPNPLTRAVLWLFGF